MKKYIYALLRLNASVKRKLDGLDRRLWRTASYAYGDTWEQIEAMLDIIEAKQRIQTAADLAEKLRKGLTQEETDVLEMKANGINGVDIAQSFCICPKSAYRKIEAALRTAENVLFLLGYDEKALRNLLCDFVHDEFFEERENVVA